MAAAQAVEKNGDARLQLILTMRDTYISLNLDPLTKFTSSSRSTEFKDIISWNISIMIMEIVQNSTRIVISEKLTGCPANAILHCIKYHFGKKSYIYVISNL